ncbi:MAG: hypothetical protein WA973_14600 [Mesorhizobium sp.]
MRFQDSGFVQIGVGGPSPYPAMADGATLDIGPTGLTLIVSMSNPAKAEIRAIRRGQLDIAMMTVGSTAVLLWRFKDKRGRPMIELESVFHIGLLPSDMRRVPSGDAGKVHGVLILLQDERATCRGLRFVSLPVEVSNAVDAVVKMQAEEASRPGWTRRGHDAEVVAYFRDYPTPADAFAVTDAFAGRQASFLLPTERRSA